MTTFEHPKAIELSEVSDLASERVSIVSLWQFGLADILEKMTNEDVLAFFSLAVCLMTLKASGPMFPVTTGTPCLMIPAFCAAISSIVSPSISV